MVFQPFRWRLFQTRFVRTKFDISFFIYFFLNILCIKFKIMIFKIFFNKIANPIISENLHSTFTRRKHLHGRFISDCWVKIRNKRSVPKPDESINQKDDLDTIQQQARLMVFNITFNNISVILWWFKRQQARCSILWEKRNFHEYFSYIVAVSFT